MTVARPRVAGGLGRRSVLLLRRASLAGYTRSNVVASLWKLEKQSDMQLTTLRRIVHAMAGELDIIARFPTTDLRICPFADRGRRVA